MYSTAILCAGMLLAEEPANSGYASSNSYDSAMTGGRTALSDGVYDVAERMFEQCVILADEKSGQRDEAVLLLLRALYEQGKFGAIFDRVGEDRGWSRDTIASGAVSFWRALALHKLGRNQEALSELAGLEDLDTANSEYLRQADQLAIRCSLAGGNTDKALEGFAAFDKKHGDSQQAAANLLEWSRTLIATGRLDEARDVLTRLGKLPAGTPEIQEGQFWKGWILAQQKKPEDAVALLREVATNEAASINLRAQSFYALSDVLAGQSATNEAVAAVSNGMDLATSPDVKRKGAFNCGMLMIRFGRVDEAMAVLKPFVSAMPGDPDSEQAQIRMAQALAERGRYSDAAGAYQVYLETFTNETGQAAALSGKGLCFLRLGRNAEAATCFQKAFEMQKDPVRKAESLFRTGDAFFANSQYKLAKDTYVRFLEMFPDSRLGQRASFQMGEAMIRLEEWQNAENVFLEISQKYPGTSVGEEALLRIAEIKDARGQRVEALSAFDKVISTYTNGVFLPSALLGRGLVRYNLYMFDRALADFSRIVAEFPSSQPFEQAFYMRGLSHYWMGRDEEAAAIGNEFLDKFPNSQWAPEVRFWMGMNAFNQENYALAETNFLSFVAQYPSHKLADEALLRAGVAASKRKEYIRAVGLLAQLAKDYPKSSYLAEARYAQADALCELADFQPAILICEEIINKCPDSEWVLPAWCRKADCQFGMGLENPRRYEESIQSYSVVTMAPTNALNARKDLLYKAEYQIGKCLEKLGRKIEAFDHYYLKILVRYGEERGRGIWHDETVKSLFTRAGFDAVDLALERQDWKSAVGVLEKIERSGVPASETAGERARKIKSEHWWLFR